MHCLHKKKRIKGSTFLRIASSNNYLTVAYLRKYKNTLMAITSVVVTTGTFILTDFKNTYTFNK